MSREDKEQEREFSAYLDSLLAGEEPPAGGAMDDELRTALAFARDMISRRDDPSPAFKEALKKELLHKLTERELKAQETEGRGWFHGSMLWRSAATAAMIIVLAVAGFFVYNSGFFQMGEPAPAPAPAPTAPVPAPAPLPTSAPEPVPAPTPAPAPTGVVTYKIEFIAEWSEATHPGSYPAGAHFSPFVAYSHSGAADALVFREGQPASTGIEVMAETGKTVMLTQEIDDLSGSGLALGWTKGNVFSSPGTDSAELQFSPQYSQLTFVSMVAPSPDWFVAQTADLLEGAAWRQRIELPLVTYDAGSDSGAAFTAADDDTQPRQPVTVFPDSLQRLGRLVLTLTDA